MRKLIIEELTIFETLNTFNEKDAYWKDKTHCYITGYIPKDALSPFRNDYPPGCNCKQKGFYYELWEHHVFAIWSYHHERKKISWDEAVNILEIHRNTQTPVLMKIYKGVKDWFIYTQVKEYIA